MQKLYFILIGSVFLLSILFAIIIWRQTIKFEKKALVAKKAKEEYLKQLMLEQEEEKRLAELRLQKSCNKTLNRNCSKRILLIRIPKNLKTTRNK